MARPSHLKAAEREIFDLFDKSLQKTFSQAQLAGLLNQQRTDWNLPERTTARAFVTFLEKQGKLKTITFDAANYDRQITRYSWGEASNYELALVWSRQAISSQLETLIRQWAVAIDKTLRRTAGARMPSEWAKRLECWDTLRETTLEVPAALPPELDTPAKPETTDVRDSAEFGETVENGSDLGSMMLHIRPLFAKTEALRRNDLAAKLAELMGCSVDDPKAQIDADNVIQAAARRGILQDGGDDVSLLARNISNYPKDVLKDQFLASLNGNHWTERSESIPRFARWLGFKRTGPHIEDAARSVINSLIRGDKLEKMGSQIRRV
jgi:hypothetical protein